MTWREGGRKRREYLGRHGTPEAEAAYRAFCKRWLARQEADKPAAAPNPGCTIAELSAAFLRHAKGYYVRPDGSQTEEPAKFALVFKQVIASYGDLRAEDFRPRHFKAIRQAMIDADLSLGVINQRMGRVRRLFRWGVAEELVDVSVAGALAEVRDLAYGRGQARETEPTGAVDWQVVVNTLHHIRWPTLKAIVLFQWWTGCRPGEACCVRAADIIQAGTVPIGAKAIRLPAGVWAYVVAAKMAHARKIGWQAYALGPKARAVLYRWLTLTDTDRHWPTTAPLWPSPHRPGRPWTTSGYAHCIERVCEENGIPHWHPHQLRHAAQQRVERLYGLEGGRKVLGHTSVQTTLGYSQRDLEGAAAIARHIG